MSNGKAFVDAWWWLEEHPYFAHQPVPGGSGVRLPGFSDNLTITPYEDRDGKCGVALECGPWEDWHERLRQAQQSGWEVPTLDEKLLTSAPTFEEAVIKLADKVKTLYGDYGRGDT